MVNEWFILSSAFAILAEFAFIIILLFRLEKVTQDNQRVNEQLQNAYKNTIGVLEAHGVLHPDDEID